MTEIREHSLTIAEIDLTRPGAVEELRRELCRLYQAAAADAFALSVGPPPVFWKAGQERIAFSALALKDGLLLGFPATPSSSLEATAPIDFWPRVRRAFLRGILCGGDPGELAAFPNARQVEKLAELVERVNIVHTVPPGGSCALRLELYAPGDWTARSPQEADMLRLVPLSREVAGLIPAILRQAGIDPAEGVRGAEGLFSFRVA